MKEPTEASTLRYHHTYQKAIGNQESTGKRRSDDDPRIPDAAPAHGRARVISTEANTEDCTRTPAPRLGGSSQLLPEFGDVDAERGCRAGRDGSLLGPTPLSLPGRRG